jgi:hypothetical protein
MVGQFGERDGARHREGEGEDNVSQPDEAGGESK